MMIDSYKIGRLMRDVGMTREDLANKIGVNRKTVYNYLDQGEIKKKALIKPIADALGVEVDWMLLPKGDTENIFTHQGGTNNNNQVNNRSTNSSQSIASAISVTNELMNLAKLLNAGLLTEEEFQTLKGKLIND